MIANQREKRDIQDYVTTHRTLKDSKSMKKIVSTIDHISTLTGKAVSSIMFLVVGIVCYEVVMRHLFKMPTVWASEAVVFCCAFLYVLGAAWTLRENRHVKIDMIWEKFSPRGKRIIDSITYVFFAFYMGMMLWVGMKFARESLQLSETSGSPWNPPVYPVKIAFVIGIILLLAQGTSKLIRDLYFIIRGKEL